MRVFLVWVGTSPPRIHFEVLSYDRARRVMRVRCRCGLEYDRVFDVNMRYNRRDYKLVTETDDAEFA